MAPFCGLPLLDGLSGEAGVGADGVVGADDARGIDGRAVEVGDCRRRFDESDLAGIATSECEGS